MRIEKIINDNQKKIIAKKVLLDLEEWFGIEEYTQKYISESSTMPFFAVYSKDEAVGFISLKETSKWTIEIYCMGILKKYHRLGGGKLLIDAAILYAKDNNYRFIQVKTVEQGRYVEYDKTNDFYRNMGFYELETFPTLWDEWNPCQIFIRVVL